MAPKPLFTCAKASATTAQAVAVEEKLICRVCGSEYTMHLMLTNADGSVAAGKKGASQCRNCSILWKSEAGLSSFPTLLESESGKKWSASGAFSPSLMPFGRPFGNTLVEKSEKVLALGESW